MSIYYVSGLPQWLSGKESACNAEATGDAGLILGSVSSPGGEHGNWLQHSAPDSPMDRGAWWITAHRVAKSRTQLKGRGTHAGYYCVSGALHGALQRQRWIRHSERPGWKGRQAWPPQGDLHYNIHTGIPLIAQSIKNLPAMQETQVRFLGWQDPLEKEMAAHSSILAWRIPWAEKPGRLQSMGSQESDMT